MIVHACHCRWCQRETGTVHALNAVYEAERVVHTGAEPEIIDTPSASGKGQKVARCPKCKVAVWSNYSGSGALSRFVRVGTLDEPDHPIRVEHCLGEIALFVLDDRQLTRAIDERRTCRQALGEPATDPLAGGPTSLLEHVVDQGIAPDGADRTVPGAPGGQCPRQGGGGDVDATPGGRHQVVRGAVEPDPARVDHEHPVAQGGDVLCLVGGQQHGAGEAGEDAPQ